MSGFYDPLSNSTDIYDGDGTGGICEEATDHTLTKKGKVIDTINTQHAEELLEEFHRAGFAAHPHRIAISSTETRSIFRGFEDRAEEEVLSHNLQVGIKAIRAFAASGQTSFDKFAQTIAAHKPEIYAKIRDFIPGMWLTARITSFPEIEEIDEDGARKVLEEVDLQVRVMNDDENQNEAKNQQTSLKMACDFDDNRGETIKGGFMNKDLIDTDAVKDKESKFVLERRKGMFWFSLCFFLGSCFFVESYVARFVADAIATIAYWKWADGLDAPVNYKVDDYEMRYHRAVIRVEKLTTFNSTLLLMIFGLLALCWIGRWVDGPSMCNPNCRWCKERIARENEPDDSYNPQGRE